MSARESDPISEPSGMVGRGAILYDTREPRARSCCARSDGRHLYHVTGVYEETESGAVRFEVWDGTHTTREWVHGDDLLAMFEPAGWSVSAGVKPTYILTRQHGVEDRYDIMTDGGVTIDKEIRVAVPRADSQGECYHAAGGPCGAHLLRNVETTIGELRKSGLHPCTNCIEDHDLPVPNGGEP